MHGTGRGGGREGERRRAAKAGEWGGQLRMGAWNMGFVNRKGLYARNSVFQRHLGQPGLENEEETFSFLLLP